MVTLMSHPGANAERFADPTMFQKKPAIATVMQHDAATVVPLHSFLPPSRPTLLQRRGWQGAVPKLNVNVDLIAAQVCKASSPNQGPNLSECFELLGALEYGSVGIVREGRRRKDSAHVALKLYPTDEVELARKEFDILNSIWHPHIIRPLDIFASSMWHVLVLELFAGKTLDATVQTSRQCMLLEADSRTLFGHLVTAIEHLHRHEVVHGGVTAASVLVSGDLSDLRLVDFRTAARVKAALAPPEAVCVPSKADDVWGAGACLHLMLTGQGPPPQTPCARREEACDESSLGGRLDGLPLSAAPACSLDGASSEGVLRKCLEEDATRRPTASELLHSPWLRL